jgi:outer membrane protein assembly factor BamB
MALPTLNNTNMVAALSTAHAMIASASGNKGQVWRSPTILVYAGCVNGSLYCLHAADGTPAGKYNAPGPINSSPQVIGGWCCSAMTRGRSTA